MNKLGFLLIICLSSITLSAQTNIVSNDSLLSKSNKTGLNQVKNQFGVELNNGFGGALFWVHYLKSTKKWQPHIRTGLAQYTGTYGLKSFSVPFNIAISKNKPNHIFFYCGTGITINFDPWVKSLSETQEYYFEGKIEQSGMTFPIEQIFEFGLGGNWILGENYCINFSGGPFMRNIYTPSSGIMVRLQFGYYVRPKMDSE
jgi:hypothetical protein